MEKIIVFLIVKIMIKSLLCAVTLIGVFCSCQKDENIGDKSSIQSDHDIIRFKYNGKEYESTIYYGFNGETKFSDEEVYNVYSEVIKTENISAKLIVDGIIEYSQQESIIYPYNEISGYSLVIYSESKFKGQSKLFYNRIDNKNPYETYTFLYPVLSFSEFDFTKNIKSFVLIPIYKTRIESIPDGNRNLTFELYTWTGGNGNYLRYMINKEKTSIIEPDLSKIRIVGSYYWNEYVNSFKVTLI